LYLLASPKIGVDHCDELATGLARQHAHMVDPPRARADNGNARHVVQSAARTPSSSSCRTKLGSIVMPPASWYRKLVCTVEKW